MKLFFKKVITDNRSTFRSPSLPVTLGETVPPPPTAKTSSLPSFQMCFPHFSDLGYDLGLKKKWFWFRSNGVKSFNLDGGRRWGSDDRIWQGLPDGVVKTRLPDWQMKFTMAGVGPAKSSVLGDGELQRFTFWFLRYTNGQKTFYSFNLTSVFNRHLF